MEIHTCFVFSRPNTFEVWIISVTHKVEWETWKWSWEENWDQHAERNVRKDFTKWHDFLTPQSENITGSFVKNIIGLYLYLLAISNTSMLEWLHLTVVEALMVKSNRMMYSNLSFFPPLAWLQNIHLNFEIYSSRLPWNHLCFKEQWNVPNCLESIQVVGKQISLQVVNSFYWIQRPGLYILLFNKIIIHWDAEWEN